MNEICLQQRRPFAKINTGVANEFGQGNIGDEEFLPDREEKEIDLQVEQEATISLNIGMEDMLKHREDAGGMLYKYDLPVENKPIVFKSKEALALVEKETELTPLQKLFDELDCDKDTAFESFIVKHHQTFNNEVDMYGDIKKAGDSQLKVSNLVLISSLQVLEFGIPIPFEYVSNEETMKQVRSMYRVNTDIPGAIELVHPNKFLPSKSSLPI